MHFKEFNLKYFNKLPTYKDLDRMEYKLHINGVELILVYCEELTEYLDHTTTFSKKVVNSPVAVCTFNYLLHHWRYSAHFDTLDNLFKVMYRLLQEDVDMIIKTENHIIEFELSSTQYEKVMDKHRNKHV
jgi:hypothetical protein